MEERYCQSCGMPMGETNEKYGTEADGSKSKDYCQYCYENGRFSSECTMEEMIKFCVPHVLEGNSKITAEEAEGMMKQWFPTMMRWKK